VRYGFGKIVITGFIISTISGTPLLAQSERIVALKSAGNVALSLAVASEDLPDAPNANGTDSSDAAPSQDPVVKAHKQSWQGAPPAARGGPFGVDRQVIDRNYMLWTGGMFAASIANVQATHDCLVDRTCAWVPSAFTRRRYMLAAGLSADAGIAYLSYYMKKKHNSLWFVPEAIVTGVNAFVGIHDARRAME